MNTDHNVIVLGGPASNSVHALFQALRSPLEVTDSKNSPWISGIRLSHCGINASHSENLAVLTTFGYANDGPSGQRHARLGLLIAATSGKGLLLALRLVWSCCLVLREL